MLRRNGNLNNKFQIRATGTNKSNKEANEAKLVIFIRKQDQPFFQGI